MSLRFIYIFIRIQFLKCRGFCFVFCKIHDDFWIKLNVSVRDCYRAYIVTVWFSPIWLTSICGSDGMSRCEHSSPLFRTGTKKYHWETLNSQYTLVPTYLMYMWDHLKTTKSQPNRDWESKLMDNAKLCDQSRKYYSESLLYFSMWYY